MAALESLRGGGLVFGPPAINGDEEEEEDSPAVSSDITLTSKVVGSCSSQMHTLCL